MNHLDEYQIQEFLDGALKTEQSNLVRQHLSACEPCRDKMRAYQMLYQELRQEPDWAFSQKFESTVLHKVKKESLGSVQERLLNALLLFGGIILAVSVTIKYTHLKPLMEMAQKLAWPKMTWKWDFLKEFNFLPNLLPQIKGLNIQMNFIVLCLLLLAAVAIIDRLIQIARTRYHFFLL